MFTKTLSLSKGWNLVSLPYLPLESELNQIFSDASVAFTYSNYSYESTTQLVPGNGYWIKLPVAKNYTILGFQTDVKLPQTNGWHLIGPTASNFNPVSIDNAAIEQIYAFGNGQYYEVNECPLGQACWVKINW
ncbi:MAG: hypothetical protein OMM_09696 [Candidatus Magnetoglobus multicellularis str. Araruama]|uniref:Uncharacterized protein n=1 Tax=Candidatus Magnetoglobus multicellularis str. Araruama TaxID=890399 RepID=A0A1V1P3E6_9BACT|nr:MAG: hypothetical protein OMM_09696 [Candidatus Magnetoglobus multicellularis str. Araruama]